MVRVTTTKHNMAHIQAPGNGNKKAHRDGTGFFTISAGLGRNHRRWDFQSP
jgi:hypothetical protein